MKRRTILPVALAIVIFGASFSGATIHQIDVGNFFFNPTKTTVNPGDTVRWVLVSGVHTTTSEVTSPKAWDSGNLGSIGGTYDVVFTLADGPGPFPYLCSFHPGSMKDTIFMAVTAEPTNYVFGLDGDQANAGGGTGSTATGFGFFTLNADSTELSIYVEHDVTDPTDVHIHLGGAGGAGPMQFTMSSAASPIVDTWMLSQTDLANLVDGNLYVLVHSTDFPLGEIRGQLVPTSPSYSFGLDGAQANACVGTGSSAVGSCVGTLAANGIDFTLTGTHDVTDPVSAHIHLGGPCVNGGVQFAFLSSGSGIDEVWMMGFADVVNLMRGDLYANIHSNAFPAGEIRGQIVNSILPSCCVVRGDSNADGNRDISDLTYYVEYMFAGGPSPVCADEGDSNADGILDISDLTFYVDFMFGGGPAPSDC